MEFFKKKWVLAIVAVLAIGLVAVFSYYLKSAAKASYEFIEAKKVDIKKTISVSGAVKPVEAVDLAFEKTGRVAAINFQVGDKVKSGQQLAILDQTDYSDQVNQALAGLEIARAGLAQAEANLKKEKERKDELVNTHASKYTVDVQRAQIKSAQALIDIQRAQIVSAQATLRSARDQHEKIVLLSPINGILSQKNIEIGEVANPTNPAFSVISQDTFKVEAFVSQKDISEIEVGYNTEMTFDSCFGGGKIELPVAAIDPAEIQENGNPVYKVSFELGKSTDCLKSGATANIEIVAAERKNVLAVPTSSVIKRGDQHFVLLEDEKHGLGEKEVEIGIAGKNGMTEILSGINEGERVVSFSK